jgi:hypothetical protein
MTEDFKKSYSYWLGSSMQTIKLIAMQHPELIKEIPIRVFIEMSQDGDVLESVKSFGDELLEIKTA